MANTTKTLGHWIANIPTHQRESEGAQRIVLRALCALAAHGTEPISDVDCDSLLSLADGTTRFFNHEGRVPAQVLIDELRQRAGCAGPELSMDIATTAQQINAEVALQLVTNNPHDYV